MKYFPLTLIVNFTPIMSYDYLVILNVLADYFQNFYVDFLSM